MLDDLGVVLAAAGVGFADVVKTTIFLTDMADFQTVNAIYGRRFAGFAGPLHRTGRRACRRAGRSRSRWSPTHRSSRGQFGYVGADPVDRLRDRDH